VYAVEELRALVAAKTDSVDSMTENNADMESEIDLDNDELDHKGLIIEHLERKGYRVTENAVIKGRSGARHILEFHAQKDDDITNHQLAACILKNDGKTGDSGNTCDNVTNRVVQFDKRTYDVGITDKVIIAVPRLSKAAKTVESFPEDSKLVCLFFDDGYVNQYEVVLPILLKHDFEASFGVITGYIGTGHGV